MYKRQAHTTLAVNGYIPIYSIVDSLSEMTTVTKVQIMINGSQDVMFRDEMCIRDRPKEMTGKSLLVK